MLRFMIDERGNALAEFVLVLPIFLILIFGILKLSLLYADKLILNYAIYLGARKGVVAKEPEESAKDSIKMTMCSIKGLKSIIPIMGEMSFATDISREGEDISLEAEYKVPFRYPFSEELPFFKFSNLRVSYKLMMEGL